MHEWLSLALLESPRLNPNDKIDTFLSRYAPPGDTKSGAMVKVTWLGLISPTWTYKLFVDIVLAISKDHWFAYSITGFVDGCEAGGRHSLVLRLPDTASDYVLWDVN
jgi:ribonucleases P/MRP protein subunit RPP40